MWFNRARRRETARLHEALRRLQAEQSAIDRSTAMIYFDLDTRVVSANDNFFRALGYSRLESIVGEPHSIF